MAGLSFLQCAFLSAFIIYLVRTYDKFMYYPHIFGYLLDVIFTRDPQDDLVAGSGYTLFIDDNWNFFMQIYGLIVSIFWGTLLLVTVMPLLVFVHVVRKEMKEVAERDRDYAWIHEHGTTPPWRVWAVDEY